MLTTATPVWPRLDLGTHRFTARGTASCDATCAAESHETASLAAARRPFHLARQHGTLHRVSAFVDRIPHAQVAFAMARVEVDLASPEAKSSHAWAAVRTRLGRRELLRRGVRRCVPISKLTGLAWRSHHLPV